MSPYIRIVTMVPATVLFLAACATTTVVPPPPTPADAEIAAIAMAVNQAEVQESEVARTAAASQAVRDYANMMVQHHGSAMESERSWSAMVGVTPRENDGSRQLASNSQQSVTALRQYSGAAFDRRYMQRQVDLHRYALGAIDQVLLPRSTDEALRAHLEEMRASVQSHLTQAQQILSSLPRA